MLPPRDDEDEDDGAVVAVCRVMTCLLLPSPPDVVVGSLLGES
jgi:hypothetical protein